MNKIYKVIWSKAKHCYVVASELAKNHTKGCGKRSLRRTAVSLGIVATLLGGFSGSAWAELGAQYIDEAHSGVSSGITVITGDSNDLNRIVKTNMFGNITIPGVVTASSITVTGNYSTTDGNITTTNGTITGKNVTATGAISGATATITGAASVGGTLGVTGAATVGSLKIGTASYGITSAGAATVSSLTVGTTLTIGTTEVETAGLTGTHTIASDSTGYVTGGTVFTAVTGGTLALSGATLNAAGNATVGGTLSVTGAATVGSLTIGTTAVDTAGLAGDHTIDSGSTGYVSGSTVYDYLNGAKLDLGAASTQIEIGKGSEATGVYSIAIGSNYDGDTYKTAAEGEHAIAIGNNAQAINNNNIAIGYAAKAYDGSGGESVAIGREAIGQGDYATAVGSNAQAGSSGVALGYSAKAGNSATAIGYKAITSLSDSVVLGSYSTSKNGTSINNATVGEDGITFGNFAGALTSEQQNRVVSVGGSPSSLDINITRQIQNVAPGAVTANSTDAINGSQLYAVANQLQWKIGIDATTGGTIVDNVTDSSSASLNGAPQTIGKLSSSKDRSNVMLAAGKGISLTRDVSMSNETGNGYKITIASSLSDEGAIVPEGETNANGLVKGSTVYDYLNGTTLALGANSTKIKIGKNSNVSGSHINSIAIGSDYTDTSESTPTTTTNTASGEYSIAIGFGNKAVTEKVIAIGVGAVAGSFDINNNSWPYKYAIAIGTNAQATLNEAIAIGTKSEASSYDTTAVGTEAKATEYGATAIGYLTSANAYASVAVGDGATADTVMGTQDSTAVGSGTYAAGIGATAIGGGLVYSKGAKADKNYAIAVGFGSLANAVSAVAIGANAQATLADSVALGSNSVANRAAYHETNNPYTAYLGDNTKTSVAWRSTHGAVSVGDDTSTTKVTRQITGVAAGTEDTDAVNVAQLKSATPVINSEHNYYVGTTTAGVKVTDAVNAVDAALGKVAAGSNYLAVYDATTPTGTFAENLTALDTAIGKVTAGNYITASEGTAATSLATQVQALDTALGAKITADGNYIRVANSINANISALDTQAKANADAISTNAGNIATLQTTATATTAAIGTLTDDGYYIKKSATNNVSQNLSALDTQVKTNADDIVTLQTKAQNITAAAGITTMKGVLNVTDSTGATTGVAIDGAAKTITAGGVVINGAANTMAVGDVAVNGAAKTITTGNVTIDGAANSITLNGTSNTLKVGGVTISDNGTAKTITGLSNTTWDADNITSGQAATEDQLKAATISLTNGGLKFTANSGGTVTNKLGSTVGVIGGGSKEDDKYSESNVKTVIAQDATGNSTITVKLDKDPSFDSVTATGKVQGASLTDGTATLTGGVLSNVTDLTANGTATFGSGTSTVIVSGGAVTATGNISGADITASGMLSSASLKVNGVDVTTPLSTAGAVVSGNAGFVTGGTVYSEVRPATDGNYVKTANSTAANLTALDSAIGMVAADGNYIKKSATNNVSQNVSALDTQVKTNADNIAMLQSSTTAAVGTLTEDGNYIKKSDTNNVVQNLSALDTQAKTNADNIAANKTAIGTTADGSYVKAANTVGKNLNALDTQVKKNTDDIATLQNSITVKEDASGVKTTTIEGNLVIKEEDGTTKDVTAALSTDGEVAKQGDAGSEGYLKGEKVYDYLNKDSLELGANSKKIAMGSGSKIKSGTKSIAIGFDNAVDGDQNVVIGTGHEVKGNNNIAVGDPINIDGNDNGLFSNTATVTGNRTYAMGYQVTITGDDTVVLGNNINGTASNAVVLGNNSTPEDGAVSVGSKDGERQIKHVAPGTDANDAATFGQLSALAQAADNSIGRLDSKVNKVGAGAAALAALHPIDTDDKFTMGLGYGNYRNAHSAAIGLFYRPTEKVMISVGGTLGNGENMINAGISFALDKGKGFGTSKAMMARKIAAQEEKITQQDAKILSLEEENAKLAARLAAIEEKLAK